MEDILVTSTVNVRQANGFTMLRNIWWNPNSAAVHFHLIDGLCLEHIKYVLRDKKFVEKGDEFRLSSDLLFLDAGCGGGLITEPLARAGATILGIDINRSAIEAAEEHAKLDSNLTNLSYRWQSIEDHCANNVEKYDVVILNFVLHHSNNHEVLVENCAKVLKPGGLVFMSSTGKTYEAWFRSIILGEYILRLYRRRTFDWNSFINSSDVSKMLQKYHCNMEGLRGIYYDIFNGTWKWTDGIHGMYFMHATKSIRN